MGFEVDPVWAGHVAPLAGAWVETSADTARTSMDGVVPLAGAWVETTSAMSASSKSPVAPLAGAWVETYGG